MRGQVHTSVGEWVIANPPLLTDETLELLCVHLDVEPSRMRADRMSVGWPKLLRHAGCGITEQVWPKAQPIPVKFNRRELAHNKECRL